MGTLVAFLLILILIVLIPVLTLIAWIISKFINIKQLLFGGNTNSRTYTWGNTGFGQGNGTQNRTNSSGRSGSNAGTNGRHSATGASSHPHGKIIPKDEGEYVDFEEV